MSGFPPNEFKVPFHIDMIRSGDPNLLADYMHELWRGLAEMQQQTSNSIFGITKDFQPTATNSAGTASVSTYQKRIGFYHRIGHLVWFTVDIQWNAADVTGTGDLYIDGLEIDTKRGTNLQTVFPVMDEDQTDGSGVCKIDPNSRRLFNFEIGNGSTLAQVDADHDLVITGVYLAES